MALLHMPDLEIARRFNTGTGIDARWAKSFMSDVLDSAGAGEGNRTPDLRFTKPLLYRLSHAGRADIEMLTHQSQRIRQVGG